MDDENKLFKPGLTRAREAYQAMPPGTSLKRFLIVYGRNFANPYAMAKDIGISHGSVMHMLKGTILDSPSLRETLLIPKNPKRWRWITGVDEAFYLELQAFCDEHELSRTKLLRYSFDVYKGVVEGVVE